MNIYICSISDEDRENTVYGFSTFEKARDYAVMRVRETFFEDGKLFKGCGADQEADIEQFFADAAGGYVSADFSAWDCPLGYIYVDVLEIDKVEDS